MNEFFMCVDCNVWSETPVKYDERKHFAKCPKCKKPMYRTPGTPEEMGLKEKYKVIATVIPHGEKL